METLFSERILEAYNPWWKDGSMGTLEPPEFKRLVFNRLYKNIAVDRRIVVITGPRRVGKTTLIRHIIQQLLKDGTDPKDIISFAMDDPSVSMDDPELILNRIIGDSSPEKLKYVFLDEVQYLPKWEKYLKRYYDLNWQVKFVVSGSAATPIFRSSRESLLGRSVDVGLPPFTFLEFMACNNSQRIGDYDSYRETRSYVSPNFQIDYEIYTEFISTTDIDERRWLLSAVSDYFIAGGFPEAWDISDPTQRTAYILDNQVDKVIFEDLKLTEDIRKPEALKKLCYALYSQPGRETNINKSAHQIGINRATFDLYLSLMERTTLLSRLNKFGYGSTSTKSANFKTYIADASLRNAILQINSVDQLSDNDMGFYAENAVYNLLKHRKDIIELSYYKGKNQKEVDFIVDLGAKNYIPIEVKYRNGPISSWDLSGIEEFKRKYKPENAIIITKDIIDSNEYTCIPLGLFLLLHESEGYVTI